MKRLLGRLLRVVVTGLLLAFVLSRVDLRDLVAHLRFLNPRLLLLGYLLYQLFEPFLRPLAWAAIFAAFFHTRHKRLEARFGKTAAASLSTGAVALIIVVPSVLVVIAFIDEARQTLGSVDIGADGSRGLERMPAVIFITDFQLPRWPAILGSQQDKDN